MNNMKRISPSGIALIGSVIILIGGFFLSYNYIEEKRVYAFSYINNVFDSTNAIVENPEEQMIPSEVQEEKDVAIPDGYIGILSIPKLGFSRGFLDKRAPGNNVEENITVLKESAYPDENKGNVIIAGHSGTGAIAFFNELYRLSLGDEAIITYDEQEYRYQLISSYKVPKTGTIAIKRDKNKSTLTLITCTNYDSTTQTVYIFNRV